MARNKLRDLNNYLFAQIERLNDEDLDDASLEREVERSKALSLISSQVINTHNLVLKAAKMIDDGVFVEEDDGFSIPYFDLKNLPDLGVGFYNMLVVDKDNDKEIDCRIPIDFEVKEKVEQAPVKADPTPKEEPVKQEEVTPVAEPESKAELVTISSSDGRFYVIVGSFYDDDLAIDKANEIIASGISAYLIEPSGDFNLYRVGIRAAQERSTAFKARAELLNEYGENIWVLKY